MIKTINDFIRELQLIMIDKKYLIIKAESRYSKLAKRIIFLYLN